MPLALGAVLVVSSVALAHNPEPKVDREIVRVQGYRGARPSGANVVAEIAMNVFGVEHTFYATDWQQYGFSAEARGEVPAPARVMLQGDRAALARVGDARPEQRVTILAERRPASLDLFVLAVDLCPDR
jgi:hypothetical protein